MRRPRLLLLLASVAWPPMAPTLHARDADLGIFVRHGDVGAVKHVGAVEYDSGTRSYVVAGGGENMWLDTDASHFVWKEAAGDVSIAADVRWIGTGGHSHRKAGVMLRQASSPTPCMLTSSYTGMV